MNKGQSFFIRLLIWTRKPLHLKLESFIYRYQKIIARCYYLQNFIFEKRYSLDFDELVAHDELIADSKYSLLNATSYEPYSHQTFKLLMRQVLSTGIKPDYLIDVGCGKGKVCIWGAKLFNFQRIIGIDFSGPLIDIANNNLAKTNYPNITFIKADAIEWKIPEGTSVVFLYNPFNEIILEKFLLANRQSFKFHKSILVYANDIHRHVLTNLGFETIYRDHRGKRSFYSVRASQPEVFQ